MDKDKSEQSSKTEKSYSLVCASCGSPSKYEWEECPVCGSTSKKWAETGKNAYQGPHPSNPSKETFQIDFSQAEEEITTLRPWIGSAFALLYYLGYLYSIIPIRSINPFYGTVSIFILYISSVGGGIYWLFHVYKTHKILRIASYGQYSISPGKAVGYHFIPFFNILWPFIFLTRLTKFISSKCGVSMLPGWFLALTIFVSFHMSRLVGSLVDIGIPVGIIGVSFMGIPLLVLFGIEMYLTKKFVDCLREAK